MASWAQVEIAGKRADLFAPDDAPRAAVVYLHTFAQDSLASSAIITELLTRHRLACLAPQGGRCWWADRVCAEFDSVLTPERFIVDAVAPFARERWNLGPRGVGLLGIDMGGQGALRIALKHADAFPAIAAIGASIEYHELYWSGTPIDDMYSSKEACRQDTAPMHIHPSHFPQHIFFACDPDDPWHRGNDRLHEKLGALGVPHECDLTTRAGGHTWAAFNHFAPRSVAFLAAGLERESRRLL